MPLQKATTLSPQPGIDLGRNFLHSCLSRKGLFALSLMREFQARSSQSEISLPGSPFHLALH